MVSRKSSLPHEPMHKKADTASIQENIEFTTKSLELERRRSAFLEEKLNEAVKRHRKISKSYKAALITKGEQHKELKKLEKIESNLDKANKKLSVVQAFNLRTRKYVDSLRKDRLVFQEHASKMNTQIKKIRSQSEMRTRSVTKFQKIDTLQRNAIGDIHKEMETERNQHFERVSQLETVIQEEREAQETAIKGFGKEKPQTAKLDQASNLLGMLKDKWVSMAKSKKKEVDDYIQHSKRLFSCIQRIKDNTDVKSVDEIVTSFQNSFEENLQLKDYAERLSQEIDELTIQLFNTKKAIEEINMQNEKTEVQFDEIHHKTQQKILKVQEKTEDLTQIRMSLNRSIENLSGFINSMKEMFDELGIQITLKRNILYGNEINFHASTARDYLIELDQYLSKLLIFKSIDEPGGDPQLASLDLQGLSPKNFEEEEIKINDFLDRDIILNSDETTVPLSTREFQEKISGILTPREDIS